MNLTAYERETVIVLNDEDDFAIVSTYQRSTLNRLRKHPSAEVLHDYGQGAVFKLPASLISIRNPRRTSTESRQAVIDRMARARAARGKTREPVALWATIFMKLLAS